MHAWNIYMHHIYIYIHNIINSWPTIVKIGLYQKTAIDSLRILNSYIQNTPCMKELPVAYIMYIYIIYSLYILEIQGPPMV